MTYLSKKSTNIITTYTLTNLDKFEKYSLPGVEPKVWLPPVSKCRYGGVYLIVHYSLFKKHLHPGRILYIGQSKLLSERLVYEKNEERNHRVIGMLQGDKRYLALTLRVDDKLQRKVIED